MAWRISVIDTASRLVAPALNTESTRACHVPLLSHSISDHRCFSLGFVSLGDESVLPRARRQFVSHTSTVGLWRRSFAARQDRWVLWRHACVATCSFEIACHCHCTNWFVWHISSLSPMDKYVYIAIERHINTLLWLAGGALGTWEYIAYVQENAKCASHLAYYIIASTCNWQKTIECSYVKTVYNLHDLCTGYICCFHPCILNYNIIIIIIFCMLPVTIQCMFCSVTVPIVGFTHTSVHLMHCFCVDGNEAWTSREMVSVWSCMVSNVWYS